MENKGPFTKILASVGAVLVWAPIFLTVALSVVGTISRGMLRFDYLMPAELFPVSIVGALLLLWAAQRARISGKAIGWSLIAAIVFLVGGQGIAVATGLASGQTAPAGWPWILVLATLVLFTAALIATGVAGWRLVRKI